MIIALKKIREEKGLSVPELAEKTGLTKTMLWNYESGRRNPDPETLCILADALDVSLDMLVRGKEKDRSKERSVKDAMELFKKLAPSDLDALMALAAFLRSRRED